MVSNSADRALVASEQVRLVSACFNEAEVIRAFMERVVALPEVDHLLLIDDWSSDAMVVAIGAPQQAVVQHPVQRRNHAHSWGASLQRCSRASISRQACCS